MNYLLWINDIIVIENEEEYDFLNEMYPEIKDKFNLLWSIKNKAEKPMSEKVRNKISKINEEIERNFQILGIQDHILFKEEDGKFIEPVSGEEFNISKKSLNLRKSSDEEVERYIDSLTNENVEFLNVRMKQFKENITKQPKRK